MNRNSDLNVDLGIAQNVHYWAVDNWTIAANVLQPFESVHAELAAHGSTSRAE